MRFLLDTQVAIWWLTASSRLSKAARSLMETSPCVLSVASLWEVALKHQIGKLAVPPARFRDEIRDAGALLLSVTDVHVLGTATLETAHRDPFDRFLLSVARAERLTLLTADEALVESASSVRGLVVRGV